MNPTENLNTQNAPMKGNDSGDIKKIVFIILRNWYWFILSILFAGGLAFANVRYSTPIYQVNTTMLFEDSYGSSSTLSAGTGTVGDVFQGLGGMGSMKNIHNQLELLKSTPIVAKTIEELNFEVSYFTVGKIAVVESYEATPFQVIWDENHPQLIEIDFNLAISPDGQLTVSAEEEVALVYSYAENRVINKIPEFSFSKIIQPGTRLTSDEFSFTILLNDHFNPKSVNNDFRFRFHTKGALIGKYLGALNVNFSNQYTSILNISLLDYNRKKGIDFLNKLTEIYLLDNLGKKNENANRTIQFINSQLENISDSLNLSENRMETFQSKNQVLNLSTQSQLLLEQMNELDKERVAMVTQNNYYHYLKSYIEKNQEQETVIAPSAMGIADPLLNSLILQLNELITQKSSQTSIKENSQHPTILRLNAQIESVKNLLLENTTNIITQSDIALEELTNRLRTYQVQVKRLPATERNFVNIQRDYQLNNEIYTFLLQKLSEAQIAKASNVPDSQVIEEAKGWDTPIEPQPRRIYAIALLLGLAFPAGIIFLRDFFNNKISSKEEIMAMTNFPILGHVFHNVKKYGSHTLVLDKPNSPASEPYQAIRNKLNLITKGNDNPVIAVTSTFPKEGKSYTSINVASTFALMRKKTVILDLDLRNSNMIEIFNLQTDLGVVNYIIGKASLEEITFSTKHPNLKLIPAGPIPPNPAEMLSDEKMQELINKLRKEYDVIVMDTPPVGYVTDMFQMNEIIDANLYVVRHKYTYKQGLKFALEEVSKHHLKGVGIIINDVKLGKNNSKLAGGYGYGYGYGYGQNDKKSKRKKLKLDENHNSSSSKIT